MQLSVSTNNQVNTQFSICLRSQYMFSYYDFDTDLSEKIYIRKKAWLISPYQFRNHVA